MTSAGSSDISGISTGNAVILINDILQGPGNTRDFTMGENLGFTTITFTGTASSTTTDANTLDFLLVVFFSLLVLLRVLDINH